MHRTHPNHLQKSHDDLPERLQFLVGISPANLAKLLWQHRFRVHPRYWRDLGQLLFLSLLTSVCNIGDGWRIGRKARRTKVTLPPVFIVGHWRSGTTLLHKLLSLDAAFCTPTFFECCLPRGFISGRRILKHRITTHMPRSQPFGNAGFGVDEPFEDEFVLAKESLLSPMLAAVFPDSSAVHRRCLRIDRLTPQERNRWQQTLMGFARKLTLVHGQRLLFKSPAHSCRIQVLRHMFPGAKFIAMQRDPFDVIASTVQMEMELLRHNSMQRTDGVVDEPWIIERYVQVQTELDNARRDLPTRDFAKIDYAHLCSAPETTLTATYAHLGIEPSPGWRRNLADYFSTQGYPCASLQRYTAAQRARWQLQLRSAKLGRLTRL